MRIIAKPLSQEAARAARARWDGVAKPLHSLGLFEDMLVKIAAVQGSEDIALKPRCVLVFCADHGVVAQGVTQSGSEVTAKVARSIAEGGSSINIMAACADADVYAVDMGMKEPVKDDRIFNLRVANGTRDMSLEPAMSREEACEALRGGMTLVERMIEKGYKLFATGEMGIGNTTAAAALGCALTGQSVETMTCRGSGLSDAGLEKKKVVIQSALARHADQLGNPLGALAALGGFEIAGMAGAFLGAAKCGAPIVIDGVISAVAALTAVRLCPEAVNFMLPSHMSKSNAAAEIMRALGLQPVIEANMALGEGTGAVMLFPLLDMVKCVYDGEHTFESLDMAAYRPF